MILVYKWIVKVSKWQKVKTILQATSPHIAHDNNSYMDCVGKADMFNSCSVCVWNQPEK